LFVDMDRQQQCVFACAVVVVNSFDMLNANVLKEGAGQSMDLGMGVQYVLATMWATLRLFKTLTNFTLEEFDELATLVVPTIERHA
jgi:hypothetical protein